MTDRKYHIDWELAARILSSEADEIDRGLFEEWLKAGKENREEWQQIKQSWEKGEDALVMKTIDTNAAWEKVRHYTVDESASMAGKPSLRIRLWLSVAASLVLLLGFLWFVIPGAENHKSSLIVANNTQEEIVLNDGSVITLNKDSRFSCNQPFDDDQRIVEIDGEGYFQVKGDKEWPFIVHAGGMTIKVTGTRFNVRAYPNLNVTEVAVLEGEVEVSASAKSATEILKKEQTALFDKKSGELLIKPSTDPNILAWLTGKMSFDETPLPVVAETLERVYGVNIQISDTTLTDEKLTARFSQNSLDFVLEVVCVTFNLQSKREGDTVFLSRATP
jgi:ferric-dicitrate binding protein FerR (iron transport regulator)